VDIAAETARAWQAFAAGRHAEAADGAARILREAPEDPGALTLSARLSLAAGEPAFAHDVIHGLLRRYPGMAALWIDQAIALRDLGRHAEAAESLEQATMLEPRNASAWVRLGEVRLNFGERELAIDAFRHALAIEGESVAALRGLGQAGAVEPDSLLADQMRALAESLVSRPSEAAGLHYALAQANRRAGRRDAFIRHLLEANALQRSLAPAGRAEYAERFDRLEAAFTAEAFAAAARAAPTTPRPIFILGMPRSGTTLVERLIGGHPEVRAGGELDALRHPLRRAVERVTGQPFPLRFETVPATGMDTVARTYANRLAIMGEGSAFVTDKTPGNFHLLGLLRLLFPQGRIVHVARDPMDTCFSILQFQFDDRSPHTCDMELLAYSYARYRRLMQRWQELCGDAFITVRYEDLVAAPAAEGRRIFGYCGLEWRDDYLAVERGGGAVRTFSALQVRRPIYRTSVGAWREYESELAPLRRALESEGVAV
jgi:tetratricopeptide (TPR) repeat protein